MKYLGSILVLFALSCAMGVAQSTERRFKCHHQSVPPGPLYLSGVVSGEGDSVEGIVRFVDDLEREIGESCPLIDSVVPDPILKCTFNHYVDEKLVSSKEEIFAVPLCTMKTIELDGYEAIAYRHLRFQMHVRDRERLKLAYSEAEFSFEKLTTMLKAQQKATSFDRFVFTCEKDPATE